MTQPTATTAPKPALDERPLWDLIGGVVAYKALAVAHRLKLFSLITTAPGTAAEVCDELKIASRSSTALLATCTAVGFAHWEERPLRIDAARQPICSKVARTTSARILTC